ncbi:D-ribose pyranase [Psychromonas sp. CNPT3]|uniref:D-ribose pyranase n=1 Tax=Psychromonas sp. CNPT3 TaxID=314282 RepID=UPI00006E4250|nr:D-ribose pyranase [Psychromonas sp. CNPT3]AGH81090.1 D-ribose pyranase [Psychromonas sp. CNPT3]
MKKTALLNPELSYLIASLGHFDEVTVCDAGLPIPSTTQRIDLALTHGVPAFITTVQVLLSEMQITGVLLASEFKTVSPQLHQALLDLLAEHENVDVQYISHENFKLRTAKSKAVVRTGECTAYANVIFQSGVVF